MAQPQTIMVPAPMYHTNGFATFLFLLAGDHLVVLEKFDAAIVVDAIERYRITNFHGHAHDAGPHRGAARRATATCLASSSFCRAPR